jgi:subtilisin family serine protease
VTGHWRARLQRRIGEEVQYIVDAFSAKGINVGVETEGTGVGYLYAEGEVLVLEQHVAQVREILDRREPDQQPAAGQARSQEPQRLLRGLILQRFTGKSVPEVVEQIDRELGEGAATPNHILTVSGEASPCAATDPIEVYEGTEPFPPVCPSNSGAGVRIFIADTGRLPDADTHPWLAGVDGVDDPASPEFHGGMLGPYTGHGTFVAGVLRCMAPAAEIYIGDVFATAGSAKESDFAITLQAALSGGWDIFHLSIASPTRKNLPLLSFGEWLKLVEQRKGTACVAPAGNSGTSRPHWPGASRHVACVGALAAGGRSRASFSNYGGWVDAYAIGRDIVNAYASGQFDIAMAPYHGQVRRFYGMAKWNGTSFSSPILTGLIAARMWRSGENASEAAAALLAEARSRAIPGVGAIVVPCCDRPEARCRCGGHCPPDRGSCLAPGGACTAR